MKFREYFLDGTLVQSHYRARWIGIIISSENNESKDIIYLVKPLFTHDARTIRKALPRKLHEHWLTKVY